MSIESSSGGDSGESRLVSSRSLSVERARCIGTQCKRRRSSLRFLPFRLAAFHLADAP
jgi:hypothetical protein